MPSLQKLVDKAHTRLELVSPGYFDSLKQTWQRLTLAGKVDPDGTMSLQYVRGALKYMNRCFASRSALPMQPGEHEFRFQLHEAEATACAELSQAQEILECCEHHFSSVRRQHNSREAMVASLRADAVDVQLDFMENMTIPLGPEEEQSWFWATARESITTLGFYAHFWNRGEHQECYWHYVSKILNHDTAFANMAFNDLLGKLPLTPDHKTLHVWADCGPHFRSYEFLWNLSLLVQTRFERVFLHFFAEHHGKGRNDGQFGLQRKWVSDYAREHVIDSLDAMKAALEMGACGTMQLDPPPKGPSHSIRMFHSHVPSREAC